MGLLCFKVHTAVGRSCDALEQWLGLPNGQVPASVVRSAYLHFEALTSHGYEFFCNLCGHNPIFLITDADKKGMFDLSGRIPVFEQMTNRASYSESSSIHSFYGGWSKQCNLPLE